MSKKDQKIKALKKELKKFKAEIKKLRTHALSKTKEKRGATNRNDRKTVALATSKAEEPQGSSKDETLPSVHVAAVR
jgi:hypothetical protein